MGYFITSFVICFYSLGAFVTRYISYEGMMPIRLLKISLFRQNIPYRFIDGNKGR
jgi:hypothetical protein